MHGHDNERYRLSSGGVAAIVQYTHRRLQRRRAPTPASRQKPVVIISTRTDTVLSPLFVVDVVDRSTARRRLCTARPGRPSIDPIYFCQNPRSSQLAEITGTAAVPVHSTHIARECVYCVVVIEIFIIVIAIVINIVACRDIKKTVPKKFGQKNRFYR